MFEYDTLNQNGISYVAMLNMFVWTMATIRTRESVVGQQLANLVVRFLPMMFCFEKAHRVVGDFCVGGMAPVFVCLFVSYLSFLFVFV